MNYIFLDMEWDNYYSKKYGKFVNEIVQIGAVKLDSKFHIIGEFNTYIKSEISQKLSSRFKRLTNITNEQMLAGVSFSEAINKYKEWCGENYVTLTWSNSDLYTLFNNTRLFSDADCPDVIGKYVDLQAYVQNKLLRKGFEFEGQLSLLDACEMLDVAAENFDMHTARDDSMLSSFLLKRTYDKRDFNKYIIDTNADGYYEKLVFKPYYLTDINDPRISPKAIQCRCPNCGRAAIRCGAWSYKNYAFTAEHFCKKCKISFFMQATFKMNYDSISIKKRISFGNRVKALSVSCK